MAILSIYNIKGKFFTFYGIFGHDVTKEISTQVYERSWTFIGKILIFYQNSILQFIHNNHR